MRSDNPPWARDSFGLGRLIEYALPYVEKEEEEESVISFLRSSISSLCASTSSERMRLEDSTEMEAFCNPLSEVEHFVRTIQTKNEEEKGRFFDGCLSLVSSLPPRVIGKRLARLLLSRYVMLEGKAHESILNHLLQPVFPSSSPSVDISWGLLPLDLYRETVLPECTHVLRVRDLHVRLAILRHVKSFAPHYSRDVLSSIVLPEILIGLDDPDDRIVAATLEAMSILVPLVGADAVLGRQKSSESTPSLSRRGGHRERAKIFVDGTPKASSPIDSLISSTVCSPVHSRPVSPLREVDRREKKQCIGASIDTPQSEMPNLTEKSMNEWNEEGGDDEGWNEGWEERTEIKDQPEEKNEEKEETQAVTVMKSTVERATVATKREENKDIGAEFALKVTVKDEIDDLFAEMQPQIKTSGSILSQLEKMAAVNSARSTVSPSSSRGEEKKDTVATTRLTFTAGDEVIESWGNEKEWGLEED
ncbi:hypothetical protein PENTCL1PPCAC_30628 [Pristionchus entomophagus]|uniref:Uncharacterized protein n=2 Tax=Pristionchus entomophagus TaxID=358040 RepID=A0AAV5URL5_9BILA|nr:hypothetical protein PENTCL1PPCAC_30628 [Pristionchus entomophagus]